MTPFATRIKRKFSGILGLTIALGISSSTFAVDYDYDPAFSYEGETITVTIRSTPGGGYDLWGRLVARHIGNHLPGNPNGVAINRPGGGGLIAMNYIFNEAPKDGTHILMGTRELAIAERVGQSGVRYRTMGYPMLGSGTAESRIWLTGPDNPVNTLEDIANMNRDFLFSAAGVGDGSYQMAELLQHAGYPVRVITGYEGTNNQLLSVLRGEVDGFAAAYPAQRGIINDENMKIIAKLGRHLEGEVEDIRETFTGDFRLLAEIMAAPLTTSRPFFTTPGAPPERVKMLQNAFAAMVNDPAFIADAERAGQEVIYTSPEEMARLYQQTLDAPDEIISLVQ